MFDKATYVMLPWHLSACKCMQPYFTSSAWPIPCSGFINRSSSHQLEEDSCNGLTTFWEIYFARSSDLYVDLLVTFSACQSLARVRDCSVLWSPLTNPSFLRIILLSLSPFFLSLSRSLLSCDQHCNYLSLHYNSLIKLWLCVIFVTFQTDNRSKIWWIFMFLKEV